MALSDEWEEPPVQFEIQPMQTIRKGDIMSVRGEDARVGKLKSGGRKITLTGASGTKVEIYLTEGVVDRLKEAL